MNGAPPRTRSSKSRTDQRQSLLFQEQTENASTTTQELLSWALVESSRDGPTTDPAVRIGPSTIGCCGNGLFTTRPIAQDDVIMVIPSEKVISVENAWEDDRLGDKFMYLTDVGGPGAKLATLAGFVAKEMNDDLLLSLGRTGAEDPTSIWKPYFNCLPWTDDHVLWWSDDEIETLLKGSIIHEEVVSMRKQVDIAIENILNIILKHHYENKQTDGSAASSGGGGEGEEMEKVATLVRRAFCMLLSRAFEDEDFDSMKLVPVLDMVQHGDGPQREVNIRHETDLATDDVIVVATRDLKVGDELFNCYSKTLSPAQFWTVFGFVPGDDNKGESARKLLEDKNPIFFPTR
eukprot:scaffold6651_cov99-Cylindrotheca_fusiformis.AAC.2